jgi:hypothetical protein
MPQQITISDETWAKLKALAEPLTDTADDVINRLLESGSPTNTEAGNRPVERSRESTEDAEDRITDQMINSRPFTFRRSGQRADYGRIPRGLRLEQEAFRNPILQALDRLGGRARPIKVLPIVEELLKDKLNTVDYEELPTGGPRWQKTAHWARFDLVRDGYIDGADHGWWAITPEGRSAITNWTI